MKYIFLHILLWIGGFYSSIYAQHTITGTISDFNTHASLPGAQISIYKLNKGWVTDSTGHFTFDIPDGDYLFEMRYTPYKTQTMRLTIANDTTIDFYLHEESTLLDDVFITGVTRATQIKTSPLAITSINANELNENSSTNIIDALKPYLGWIKSPQE